MSETIGHEPKATSMRGPLPLLALAFAAALSQAPARAADSPGAGASTGASTIANGGPIAGPSTDPTQVRPGAYRLDPDHAKITWSLSHLGYSTYYGQIADVTGDAVLDPKDPMKIRLKVAIGTDSITGVNPKLDARLKAPDFFDTVKFPSATFTATAVEPTSPTTARVTGDLTLRGITKPVAFDATFNQAGLHPVDKTYTVGFDGRAVLKRSEFGIDAYLPMLGDEVVLRLEGEFKAIDPTPRP